MAYGLGETYLSISQLVLDLDQKEFIS